MLFLKVLSFFVLLCFIHISSAISPGADNAPAPKASDKDVDGESDDDLVNKFKKKQSSNNDGESSSKDVDGISDDDLVNKFTNKQDSSSDKENSSNVTTTKSNISEQNGCRCVKYYECQSVTSGKNDTNNTTATPPKDDNSKDPQDILGIVDIRENLKPQNGSSSSPVPVKKSGCGHYFEVCCKTEKPDVEGVKKKVESEPEEPKPDAGSIMKNWVHTSCGQRHENGIGFKIKGMSGGESQFGEFPWMVAITEEEIFDNLTRNSLLCGGSLIHPSVVLTAAHCVFEIANSPRYKQLKVRVGEWDTQTLDEPYPYQQRDVREVVIHNQLYQRGLYNDIALLFLSREVKLAPNVDTVCLPPASQSVAEYNGESCFSSGWGKDTFGVEGRYQSIMKKVEVPIIPRGQCQASLKKTRLGDRFSLHDSFMCAGGQPGKDTCVGDGGSPLVCKGVNSQNYVQVGIVAWGIGCGGETPGVYVNIFRFIPWIHEKLKKRNLDMKS